MSDKIAERDRQRQRRLDPVERSKDAAKTRATYANMSVEERRAKWRAAAAKHLANLTIENKKALYAKRAIYYKANPDSLRNCNLRKNYGIGVQEWNALLANQNNCCAICKKQYNADTKKWHTDHDHVTGKVRGILCHHCNVALGNFHDNAIYLQNAIIYLQEKS